MMTVVKPLNQEFQNEIIRKTGDLKSVREMAKAFDHEVAKEGGQMINTEEANAKRSKEDPGVKRISRPWCYSTQSNTPSHTADRSQMPNRRICIGCGT